MRDLKLIPNQKTSSTLAKFLFTIKKQKPMDLKIVPKFTGTCLTSNDSYAEVALTCTLQCTLAFVLNILRVKPSTVVEDGQYSHIYDRTGQLLVSMRKVGEHLNELTILFDCSDFYPYKTLPASPEVSVNAIVLQIHQYLYGGSSARTVPLLNNGMQFDLSLDQIAVGSVVDITSHSDARKIRRNVKVIGLNQLHLQQLFKRTCSMAQIKPFIIVEYRNHGHREQRVIYPSQVVGISK